jgi:hypothetical protein
VVRDAHLELLELLGRHDAGRGGHHKRQQLHQKIHQRRAADAAREVEQEGAR